MPTQELYFWSPGPNNFGQTVPLFSYPGPFPILSNTYNEIYSVDRFDSVLNVNVRYFWNIELPTLTFCNCYNPNTLQYNPAFCPLQNGEEVTIYRFECNTTGKDISPEGSSHSEMIIQVVDGVATIVGGDKQEIDPVKAYSCVPVISKVIYQADKLYFIETLADVDDEVKEADEDNNALTEENIYNLKSD